LRNMPRVRKIDPARGNIGNHQERDARWNLRRGLMITICYAFAELM